MEYILILGYKKKKYTIEIPIEVEFFSVNGNIIYVDKVYYFDTILKTNDYKDWINYLYSLQCSEIKIRELDAYTFIEFQEVSSETLIPIINREEFFKKNNINLWDYTFVCYNEISGNIDECFKITDFRVQDCIYCARVTRKSSISSDTPYLSISLDCKLDLSLIINGGYRTEVKILKGEESKVMWNTIMWETISKCDLDLSKIDKNLKLDAEEKPVKFSLKEYLENFMLENITKEENK